MRLFTRKKAQPEPTIYNDETTFTPIVETPLPVQICSHCGREITADEKERNQFMNGDLYLKRLQYNFLCHECADLRNKARNRHNVANQNTIVQSAVKPARKPVTSGNLSTDPIRQPSRPLIERFHDLSLEA